MNDPNWRTKIMRHIDQLEKELPGSGFPNVVRKLIKEYTDKLNL